MQADSIQCYAGSDNTSAEMVVTIGVTHASDKLGGMISSSTKRLLCPMLVNSEFRPEGV